MIIVMAGPEIVNQGPVDVLNSLLHAYCVPTNTPGIKSSIEWVAKGLGSQGDLAKKSEEILVMISAFCKKMPKGLAVIAAKKDIQPKVLSGGEKVVKWSTGTGDGGKGGKDLRSVVEVLEQRVKTLEVIVPSSFLLNHIAVI